jgi:hypothetical protein
MAKYIFETDDKDEAELHLKAGDYKICLWDMDQYLRSQIKYNPKNLNEGQINALEDAREELREILSKYDVSLD